MQPLLKQLFDLLAGLTTPVQGSRTHAGALIAAALLLYALWQGNVELAGAALAVVLSVTGLKPSDPPSPPNPDLQPLKPA